jgi:hypothetical protein
MDIKVDGKHKLIYISSRICKSQRTKASKLPGSGTVTLESSIHIKSKQMIDCVVDYLELEAYQAVVVLGTAV